MQNPFDQNELISKRWIMLAGGPESFGASDEPVDKISRSTDQEQRSQLAHLAGKVETDQTEQANQKEQEEGVLEAAENPEESGNELKEGVEKTLGRSSRVMEKFDTSNPTDGQLMQKLVEKTPDEAAVDQLGNEELTQRWEQDLVALTRSQVQDIEPGALAG